MVLLTTFLIRRAVPAILLAMMCLYMMPDIAYAQMLTGPRASTPAAEPPSPNPADYRVEGSASTEQLLASPVAPPSRPGPSYTQAQLYRETAPPVPDSGSLAPDNETPVDLVADNIRHNDQTGEITASGNVELVQGGRILRADLVSYNLETDTVTARGNVVLTEPTGDVHFAEEVRLSNEMSAGFVQGLHSYLAGGGYFRAELAERVNEKLMTMRNAAYTPCDCAGDEDGDPAWQILADEVTFDENENQIRYKNARFELFGVPVAWTPFLAHPDGQVKRKSGLLAPQVGFDSELGITVTQNYYWDIAPNKDATFGVMLTTQELPVGLVQYRQRFAQAEIQVDASGTYSERNDQIGGREVITDEEFRGHLFTESLWNIDEKWRAGLDLELTTDDQYLRQYDFSSKDVLENELYVERFSGRNYGVGRLLAFQDTRVEEEQTDQPNVFPEVRAHFIGEPNKTLGGRWELDTSALQLQRDGGQDMTRLTARAGWQRRLVTDFGLVNTFDASVRGDAYYVNDRDVATAGSGLSNESEEVRYFPQAHLVSSYPLVRPMERMQAVIEPVAALTIATDIDSDDSEIPNEDSQDVQLDAGNLFEASRFPGMDRVEDRSRVTYGARAGLYGHGGSYGDIFIGQSYRFEEDDNPFPDGSGLSDQESDWVGQVAGVYDDRYGVNYRFQLNGTDFSARRHEIDGFAEIGRLDFNTRYLFAEALEGTDIEESREQVFGGAAFRLTENWRVRGTTLHDLGENPGLREATFGFDYEGCCLSFSATVERNITSDVSGDSGTDIRFRIGLKGLGEFAGSQGGTFGGRNY